MIFPTKFAACPTLIYVSEPNKFIAYNAISFSMTE